MLLPTKGIEPERALLTVGARILQLMDRPATVSGLWEKFRQTTAEAGSKTTITFDWFALALSALYALGAIDMNESGQLVRSHVSS